MTAPAVPGPVLVESGDTEQRAAYADANDPIAAAPPSVKREPSLAGAAVALTRQTILPALTPAVPGPVAGESGDTKQRSAHADTNDPIGAVPPSVEREPPLARAAVTLTRQTILPALTPAVPGPVAVESGDTKQRSAYADTNDPIVAAPPSVRREPPLARAAATLTRQTIPSALTPAAPRPVAGESGDTTQRAAYADANGPIVAAPSSVEREPSLARAALTLTRQTPSHSPPLYPDPVLLRVATRSSAPPTPTRTTRSRPRLQPPE